MIQFIFLVVFEGGGRSHKSRHGGGVEGGDGEAGNGQDAGFVVES